MSVLLAGEEEAAELMWLDRNLVLNDGLIDRDDGSLRVLRLVDAMVDS